MVSLKSTQHTKSCSSKKCILVQLDLVLSFYRHVFIISLYKEFQNSVEALSQSAKDAEIMWGPHRIAIFSWAPDTHMGSFRILYSFPTWAGAVNAHGGLYLPCVISTSDSPWRGRLSQWRCDVRHCHTQRARTFHWPALWVHRHGDLSLSRFPEWSEKEHMRKRSPPLPIGSLCLWLWLLVLSAAFFERPDLPRSHGFVTATLISLFAISAVRRSHTNRKGWLCTIYLRMGSNTPVSRRMYLSKWEYIKMARHHVLLSPYLQIFQYLNCRIFNF